jgi:hypothetical protein
MQGERMARINADMMIVNQRIFEEDERKRKARIHKWRSRGYPFGNGFANGLTLLAFAIVSAIIGWKMMEIYFDYYTQADKLGLAISLIAIATLAGILGTMSKPLGLTLITSLCAGMVVLGVYTSASSGIWTEIVWAIFDCMLVWAIAWWSFGRFLPANNM